jgi:predicted transcriptional regulator
MNKEQQINRLATDIYSMLRSDAMSRAMASMLYGEGYRKVEIDERIKYAEQKRDEAFSNDSVQSIVYWDGYIAALKAVKEGNNDD